MPIRVPGAPQDPPPPPRTQQPQAPAVRPQPVEEHQPTQNAGNPYLDSMLASLDQQEPNPRSPANPYADRMMADLDDPAMSRRREARFMGAFRLALEHDPAAAAEAHDIARKLGKDPRTVADNIDVARRLVQERAVRDRDLASTSPVLAEAMANFDFAKIASRDVDNLATTESTFGRLAQAFEAGQSSNERGWIGIRKMMGSATAADAARLVAIESLGLASSTDSGFLASATRIAGQQSQTMPATLAVAGVASAAATPVAGAVAGGVTAFGLSGLIGSGNAYLDMVDRGIPDDVARRAAFGAGAVEGGLDALASLIQAAPFLKAGAKIGGGLTRATARQALGEFVKDYALSYGGELVTETAQTIAGHYIEEAAAAAAPGADPGTPLSSEVAATMSEVAKGMAVLALPGPALNLGIDLQRTRRAKAEAEFFRDLDRAATASAVRQQAPDVFGGFVGELGQRAGADTVYVDGQKLAEGLRQGGMSDEDVRRELPEIADQVAPAAAFGNDVAIPMRVYAEKIAGTSLSAALQPHLRLDVDDGFRQGDREQADELAKDTQARDQREKMFREDALRVADRHLEQIRGTGKFSEAEARGAVALFRAFVETRARGAGLLPGEFMAQFPLVVRAAEDATDAAFRSSGARGDYHPDRGIRLFAGADVSTIIHEQGHWFLDVSVRLAASEKADSVVVDDVRAFLASNGIESVEKWNGMSLAEQRAAHERFAYGFEEYLATGRAPSAELQGVFRRFRSWLSHVYGYVRQALVRGFRKETGQELPELSPEVRGFFDRMLASEEAIARTEQAEAMVPLFAEKPANMSDADWSEYQRLANEARNVAGDDLTAASIRQMRWYPGARSRVLRDLQKKVAAVREAVRAEVAPQVRALPVYRAMRFLRDGVIVDVDGTDGGTAQGPTKLATAAVRAILPDLDLRKLALTSKDGVQPDTLAPVFGYPSGEAMVRELAAAPPIETAIDNATTAQLQRDHAELLDPDRIEDAVAAALHNDARARFVAVENRIVAQSTEPVRASMRAARMAAERIVSSTQVRALRPRNHTVAEARAAREARKAMRKGDTAAVVQAKRQQLVQLELARQSRTALLEVQAARQRFREFFRPDATLAKTRNVDLIDAARSILAHFGFGSADKSPAAYVERIAAYNPALMAELLPIIGRATTNAKDHLDLTVDEFRTMRDAVEALWHQARREMQVEVEGQKLETGTVAMQLADRLRELGLPEKPAGQNQAVTSRDEWVRDGQSAVATTSRVEHWAAAIGPQWTKAIFRRVKDALTAYKTARNDEVSALDALLQKHREAGHMPEVKIEAPEIDYTFANKAELLHALLHTGNDGNLLRLLLGSGWGTLLDDGRVDTRRWDRAVDSLIKRKWITERDAELVQAVWDLMERQKPLLQRTHHELFGHYFTEVEARPVVWFGREFRGGYVPAIADKFVVQAARLQDQMAELEGDFRNTVPSVPRGFTKARAEVATRRLALDLRVLGKHLDDVLRFAHVQPAVRDVLRILNHPELQPVLAKWNPTAHEKLLLPWLHRSARGTVVEPGKNKRADRFWRAMRVNSGLRAMVGNVVNAAQNVSGLFSAMVKARPGLVINAAFRAIFAGREMAATMAAESPFMRDRSTKTIFDSLEGIDTIVKAPSVLGQVQQFSQKHGYVLQRWTQTFVDMVTWHAARNQALEDLGPNVDAEQAHREATARADAAVRLTQGSADPEDVSAFEVGTPFWKALTQFMGWFNNFANLNTYEAQRIVRELGWRRGAPQLFGLYVFGMALPLVAAGAIAKTFAGTWSDDDRDGVTDEFLEVFFGSQLKGALQAVPLFGQIGTLAWNVIGDGESYNDRMPLPASLSMLESSAKAVRDLGG
ncbi:MAG: hypothetical protein RJA36_2467, partial [Pseudomonadota bacterium]